MHIDQIADKITEILNNNGIDGSISPSDITVSSNIISDFLKQDHKVSRLIIEKYWPPIHDVEVYHYTSREAAKNIIDSQTLRFYRLDKRFTDDELKAYCENHQLSGYLETNINGDPYYKTDIMPITYYMALTETGISEKQENYFWRTFAGSDGVRLKLTVKSKSDFLRKILYEKHEKQPIKVLIDLDDFSKSVGRNKFVLKGQSTIGSYFLSQDYEIENEIRALFKMWEPKMKEDKIDENGYHFVEFDLNREDYGYTFQISEIQTNESEFHEYSDDNITVTKRTVV